VGPAITHPWHLQFIIKVSAWSFSIRRVPVGPFCIRPVGLDVRRVPMGPTITHPWRLQFIIKVSARSFLHPTCTCGTPLHPTCGTRRLTCTSGTCNYTSVMLAICHKSLCSVLSPSDMYIRDPSTSDLWALMAYVSRLPVGPFSISIRPMGPDSLRVTYTIWLSGFNFTKKVW
jgi:hypothetical protein